MTDINKENKRIYNHQYWMDNREKYLQIRQCNICGGKYSLHHRARHSRSKYHKMMAYFKNLLSSTMPN